MLLAALLSIRPSALSFPILFKELFEQAARKRTYIIRVLYAVPLFFIGMMLLWELQEQASYNPMGVLGRGRQMFDLIVVTQFGGICIFLPAIMCNVITHEKERNSLVLVMLTDLRPWEIVLQKYAGRLVTMFTFLLLALPLMAIAYSLGGITPARLWSGVYLLFLACLQIGALSLMMSAFCRSSVAAFIGSYVLGAAIYLGPMTLYVIAHEFGIIPRIGQFDDDYAFMLCPIFVFFENGFMGGAFNAAVPFLAKLVASIPILISIAAFLVLARVFLVKRAFLQPRNWLLGVFRVFDRAANRANKLTGGVVIIKDRGSLPEYNPVAWREVTKKSLGKARYLLRILVVVEGPLAIIVAAFIAVNRSQNAEVLSVIQLFLWPLAALVVTVQSANTMVSERTHQTLEVLMTTPMTGRDIILQKTAAIRRMIMILWVPFLTLILAKAWWEYAGSASWGDQYSYRYNRGRNASGMAEYLACALLAVAIYLPMVSWFAMWIGLKMKSTARAIITAVGGLVLWLGLPPLLVGLLMVFSRDLRSTNELLYFMLASPATILPFNEFHEWNDFRAPAWLPIFINFAFHGGTWVLFRHLCLSRADKYLGRVTSE